MDGQHRQRVTGCLGFLHWVYGMWTRDASQLPASLSCTLYVLTPHLTSRGVNSHSLYRCSAGSRGGSGGGGSLPTGVPCNSSPVSMGGGGMGGERAGSMGAVGREGSSSGSGGGSHVGGLNGGGSHVGAALAQGGGISRAVESIDARPLMPMLSGSQPPTMSGQPLMPMLIGTPQRTRTPQPGQLEGEGGWRASSELNPVPRCAA